MAKTQAGPVLADELQVPGLPQERPQSHCEGFRSKASAESQPGRGFGGSRNHVPEVCERHAAVPAGSGMETAGGVTFSRTHWIIRCAEDWPEPLWDAMRKGLLKREVLHADETVVQVLKENGKTAQSKSYMWVYRTGMDGLPPIVLYDYQPGRSGEHPKKFLEGFHGYLVLSNLPSMDFRQHPELLKDLMLWSNYMRSCFEQE